MQALDSSESSACLFSTHRVQQVSTNDTARLSDRGPRGKMITFTYKSIIPRCAASDVKNEASFFEIIGADVKKGRLQLEWLTNRAGPYTLQASPNLQTWEDVLTTNAKQAEVEIEESERFYRVIR